MSYSLLWRTVLWANERITNKRTRAITVCSLLSLATLSATFGIVYAVVGPKSAPKSVVTFPNDVPLVSDGDDYSETDVNEKNAETRSKKNASDDDKKNSSAGDGEKKNSIAGNDDKKSSNSGEKISSGVVTGTARNSERARASSARVASGASSNNNNGNSVVAGPKGRVKRNLPPWLDAYSESSIYSEALRDAYGVCDGSRGGFLDLAPSNNVFPEDLAMMNVGRNRDATNTAVLGAAFRAVYYRDRSGQPCTNNIPGVDLNNSSYIGVFRYINRLSSIQLTNGEDCYLLKTSNHFKSMRIDHSKKVIYVFDSFLGSSPGIVPKDGYQVKAITAGEQHTIDCGCFAVANLVYNERIIEHFCGK